MSALVVTEGRARRSKSPNRTVPPSQPVKSKRLCRRGHLWTVANTRVSKNGKRACLACDTINRHRQKAERLKLRSQRQKLARVTDAMYRMHPDRFSTNWHPVRLAILRGTIDSYKALKSAVG